MTAIGRLTYSHSIRRDHIPDGRLLPLPLASLMLKRLAPWIRMPLVFPDVLAASTAMFLDAVPEVPGTTAQSPRQVSLEHLSELTGPGRVDERV